VPGSASPTEKACFRSHQRAVEASLADDGPSLIVEDDVAFSPRLPRILAAAMRALGEWDVLLLECLIADPREMLRLSRQWTAMVAEGRTAALDLSKVPFGGATAYVVSPAGKRRLLDGLGGPHIDRAYDLRLGDMAKAGNLRTFALYPFPVTLGPEADASLIRPDRYADAVLSLWRRSMFVDRDDEALGTVADAVLSRADPRARLLGAVFAGMASPDFPSEV
jgi:GR25 family glycosyltransferase involved in LPS biosynthesis